MIKIGDRYETENQYYGGKRKLIFNVIKSNGKGWYRIINDEVIDIPYVYIPNMKLDNKYNARYCPIAETLYINTSALYGNEDNSQIYLNKIDNSENINSGA